MQTNTPAPVQRNRRAGRLSPLDTADAAQQPSAVTPTPAPTQPMQPTPVQPAQHLQPLHPSAAAVPQYRTAAPANAPAYPQPAAVPGVQPIAAPATVQQHQPAYRSPGYPQSGTQIPAQPTARRTTAAAIPSQTRSVPAGGRPQAAAQPVRMRHDDPDARRAASARVPAAQQAQPVERRKEKVRRRTTPSWLKSLLSLMLVVVMALVAGTAVMMATLKTKADERQKAWENVLFNYHLTEREDGTLCVTWQNHIEHYAAIYNLDPAFVTAVIRNESSFRTEAVSSVGARGLMQMMPDTTEWIAGKLGDRYDFDRLFDAETAIRYGCWYLGYLADLFGGDTVLVCAAYHAGQGEVLGWLGDPDISPDGVSIPISNIPISNTRTYTERVTKAYGVYDALLYPDEPAQATDMPGARGADAYGMPVR